MSDKKAEWIRKCASILKVLKNHKHGWVFAEPVDPVALGIPDYFQVIKRPMDLGTVKIMLDNSGNMEKEDKLRIDSPESFEESVMLAFENAMQYNPATHDVHVMAKALKEVFVSKWDPLKPSVIEKWRVELSGGSTGGGGGGDAAPAVGKRLVEADFSDDRPMTYEEKRELSANMNKLPGKKLGSVVQIIHDRNHKILQPNAEDPDEIEIDIDKIDDATLRYLDTFVKDALAKKKKKTG
mmetsp:Transcript_62736/g.91966  ORF Transcript_62736/g.91966 Transcript_62736/m.91966 type:complete len:239 (+) Transcript_62736:196-912(+)